MASDLEPKVSPDDSTLADLPPAPPKPALSFLPEWVSAPLKSPRAWKLLLRCWVAGLASFVILLPNASLRTLGTTSFFALLTALFLPPYLPVQLTIFLLSTLMIGLLGGWGIGLAAMRAANAVRSQAIIQAATLQIQASIKSNPVFQANPALAKSAAVFAGWFLDIRSTAVYGAFLVFGAFIFGLIRAYAPKLIFMSIFGTIALDIFCSIGPLFPSARYTLLNSVAISVGCYMAIAILTTLFVFPETMSRAIMIKVSAQLARVERLVQMQDAVLAAPAADLRADAPLIQQFRRLRSFVIGEQQQLIASSGLLSLEFTWGRWNGDDVRSLEAPFIALLTRVGCLLNFDRLAGRARLNTPGSTSQVNLGDLPDTRAHDGYLLRQIHTRDTVREKAHGVRPDDVLPTLDTATRALRTASIAGLAAVRLALDDVNAARWRGDAARQNAVEDALDAALEALRKAVGEFEGEGRMELLKPFLPLLEAAAAQEANANAPEEELPLRSLFVVYVFAANVLAIAQATLGLMEAVRDVNAKRRKARLWAPTGLRSIWKLVTARGDKTDGAFGEDTSARVPNVVEAEAMDYRRDPDSRPPTNILQKMLHGIHNVYQWTSTAEAVFTFKYVFISVALWLPAVFRSSANFYYVEKGIWALIMAQTTLNIYAADQIFNYVTRLLGTLIGLVFGLAAWYAGNGTSNGNPYGIAAAVGVAIIPLMFMRVFAPERYLAGNILCCATFALVVGYSWIDGHTVQFASPGLGWSVAWRRWTLVAIGSAASFILMMFPPKSSRKAVRQRNASSIASLGSAYGSLISTWIANRDDEKDAALPAAWSTDFGALMALAEEMHTIRELTELAKWEGSFRGQWPAEEYTKLIDVQVEMIASLTQLGSALGHLEREWRTTFRHSSKVLNPNFIADVMAIFTLISQSLRTGEPMSQVLPHSILERLVYHHGRSLVPAVIIGRGIDVQQIKSLSYMQYASAVVAVYQLLASLDELHAITKELCGEMPMAGFASWREEYERAHVVL
ncbi:hypothetical protein C8J57DRAFT_1136056 [Mycena rebaudengoi]|nr:hypothetical protein C8J57DRAFT_1136056 [Mycena rebaudengoi]